MQLKTLRKGIALGGLDTFNFASEMVDDRKPVVPFMVVKEHRKQVNTEDTIKVVKESIQDSIYENNKTMMRLLDKIGDRLADVVEDFQKKQSSRNSRNRYRDRSNSRDRDNSGDSYRNRSRDRGRSNSRENRNNQQRSGSGQRYYDIEDICDYYNITGHSIHECFKLENYLRKQGKRIVLHDNDDIQDIAQAVQDLNTKINSMKLKQFNKKLKDSLCVKGNPKICPKPCPSVSFSLKLDKIEETYLKDSFVETETESFQNEITFSCSEQEQTQLGESFISPEVESDNLSESDIGPFDILYGEMDEDNFHQKMEDNDLTYYPLFSDKEFLNEDWHNYTCIESCAAIEDARHGCECVILLLLLATASVYLPMQDRECHIIMFVEHWFSLCKVAYRYNRGDVL